MTLLLSVILGTLVGISSALLGLGGNIIIVPLLSSISDLSLQSVVATGIFSVFIVTLINVINFYRQQLLDFKLIATLIIPTALASYLSSYYAPAIPQTVVKTLFITVMLGMFARLLMKSSYQMKASGFFLVFAGFFSGSLAGLTGIGTGVILAPLLFSSPSIQDKKVSPTINFLIMVSCFISSLNYLSWDQLNSPLAGYVRLDYALYITIPALITSILGRKLNKTIDPMRRKMIVSAALLLLIVKTIISF